MSCRAFHLGVLVPIVAAALVGAVGCRRGGSTPPADPLMDVFRREAKEEGLNRAQADGKRLFVLYCVTCHGDVGEGDGQNAFNLSPKPPDFGTSLKAHPPSYWRQVIEGGTAAVGRSPLCPPWGRSLSPQQIDSLVSFLEVLRGPVAASRPSTSSTSPQQ